MTERLVRSGDATLATQAFGSPRDTPILLIMGATASMIWWPSDFVAELAAHGRYVIRYDMRDTGRSATYPHGAPPYGLDDLADDAAAVLDACALERAHIVGMSLGGLVGQILALKYPARVASLTLISAQMFGPTGFTEPEMDGGLMAHFVKAHAIDWTDEAAAVAQTVETWRLIAGQGRAFDADSIRALAVEDFRRANDPGAALNHQQIAGGEQWYGHTAEIAAPVLLIHGSHDPVIPIAHAEAVATTLPGSTLLRLEGAGHELHRSDWPAMIAALVRHTA